MKIKNQLTRIGVEQPDGTIEWQVPVVIMVTHKLPNGELVFDEHSEPINANHVAIVSNPPDRNATIMVSGNRPKLITQRCELGEHCRCVKGDEPGCWNWPE